MFTGLVSDMGAVEAIERGFDGARLRVGTRLAEQLRPGDSIAVNGACLTAVEASTEGFRADVIAETLERSSLGSLEAGDRVNLELPLGAGDRLGGHFVQGHVDGTATVERVTPDGFARVVQIAAAPELCAYVVEKGSVALDGVSLTAVEVYEQGFGVALIPETLERTTLGGLEVGGLVNVEVDVLAKYVQKLAAPRAAELAQGLT